MTAKISASADGTKVYLGNASENALEIDATGKLIKPVAPYAFDFSSLPFSKTQNGYMTLPNGFILQWGINDTQVTGPRTITFPIAFPNFVLQLIATPSSMGDMSTQLRSVACELVDLLSFIAKISFVNNGGLVGYSNAAIRWIAIGC